MVGSDADVGSGTETGAAILTPVRQHCAAPRTDGVVDDDDGVDVVGHGGVGIDGQMGVRTMRKMTGDVVPEFIHDLPERVQAHVSLATSPNRHSWPWKHMVMK